MIFVFYEKLQIIPRYNIITDDPLFVLFVQQCQKISLNFKFK